jgi:hypothetical protein
MMEADLMTDTLFIAYVPQTVDVVQQYLCNEATIGTDLQGIT